MLQLTGRNIQKDYHDKFNLGKNINRYQPIDADNNCKLIAFHNNTSFPVYKWKPAIYGFDCNWVEHKMEIKFWDLLDQREF